MPYLQLDLPVHAARRRRVLGRGRPRHGLDAGRGRRPRLKGRPAARLRASLEIFPYEGYTAITDDPTRWAWHLALPVSVLALVHALDPRLAAAD
jgi:hypothetical protein